MLEKSVSTRSSHLPVEMKSSQSYVKMENIAFQTRRIIGARSQPKKFELSSQKSKIYHLLFKQKMRLIRKDGYYQKKTKLSSYQQRAYYCATYPGKTLRTQPWYSNLFPVSDVVKVKDLILPRPNSLETGVKRRKDNGTIRYRNIYRSRSGATQDKASQHVIQHTT